MGAPAGRPCGGNKEEACPADGRADEAADDEDDDDEPPGPPRITLQGLSSSADCPPSDSSAEGWMGPEVDDEAVTDATDEDPWPGPWLCVAAPDVLGDGTLAAPASGPRGGNWNTELDDARVALEALLDTLLVGTPLLAVGDCGRPGESTWKCTRSGNKFSHFHHTATQNLLVHDVRPLP